MASILGGLKVVELGEGIPAAHCAKILGDFGAEVIKVEPPEGDVTRQHGPWPGDRPDPEASGLFLALNVNKLGITLDVTTATGREILLRLLGEADVFVTNLPLARLRALHLTYEELASRYPRLIATYFTIFGLSGPYADYAGDHLTASCAGTQAMGIGRPDREPLQMPLSMGGYQAGAAGFTASMAALLARERSGAGQCVDIAEAEVLATLYNIGAVVTYAYRGVTGIRRGSHGSALYPDCLLRCKDGAVGLVCNQLAQWLRFLELMGMPEWTKLPRYRDRRKMAEEYADEVDALMAPWMMEHTKAELFAMCREKHIPLSPCNNAKDLMESEHLRTRDAFVAVTHPVGGTVEHPAPPYKLSATPAAIRSPAPLLGEHNAAVLGERLGYDAAALAGLRQAGVI